jgi:hypothetical protein
MAKPNPVLVKYIEHHLAKGFKISHIKRKLAEVGHPIEAIEDAAEAVLQTRPKLRKKPKKFMIIYGVVLILIIAGFAWFVWYKATQQIEYTETVAEVKKNVSYRGMTDVQLLTLAGTAGDMAACGFIRDHNTRYACIDRYWEREDCAYYYFLGEDSSCWQKKAMEEKNLSMCDNIPDETENLLCKSKLMDFAISSKDVSICDMDYDCVEKYSFKLNSPESCKYTEEFNAAHCYYAYAVETGDFSVCAKISELTAPDKEFMLVECNEENPLYFKDTFDALCSGKISEDETYFFNAVCAVHDAISQKDSSRCFEDSYYASYFDHPGNKGAKPAYLQSFCIALYAFHTTDANSCSKSPDKAFETVCDAKVESNINTCNTIQDKDIQLICNAWMTGNKTLCADVTKLPLRTDEIGQLCLGLFSFDYFNP